MQNISRIYDDVYTGEDIVYISNTIGNDDNDGATRSNPKKTIQDYGKKYYYLLEGEYNLKNLKTGDMLPFDCEVLCDGINKVTINVLQDYVAGGYWLGWRTNFKNHIYNATINIYVLGNGPNANYNDNLKFFNSIINISGFNYLASIDYATNCHIINNGKIQGGGQPMKCNNSTLQYKISPTIQPYSIELATDIATDIKNIDSRLLNSGNPLIFNKDGKISNIGITGGPYYFDGTKNVVFKNFNVNIIDGKVQLNMDILIKSLFYKDTGKNLNNNIFNDKENNLLSVTLPVPKQNGEKFIDVTHLL